jgi:HEAT repeat protein
MANDCQIASNSIEETIIIVDGDWLTAPASLSTEACDRVVVVEDSSDENYLRWWMKLLLPSEQWDRLSKGMVFLYTERRPTGDEVNQRLDTIIRTHPDGADLRPKAFVVADRDYRLDDELHAEQRKLSTKPFARQTWHVWNRVEIENYLLCPDAIVRYVRDHVRDDPPDPRFPSPSELDVRVLVEESISRSREAARNQLVNTFARLNKGQAPSTWVVDAEKFLNSQWHGQERLRWCDAKEVVLPHLKGECKRRWNVALSEQELMRSLATSEVPEEILQVVSAIALFLAKSYLLNMGNAEKETIRPLVEALRSKSPSIRRTAAESLAEGGRAGLPALSKALKDDDLTVRRAAVWSLMCIGHKAGPATPALTAALADDDAEVRRHAAAALGDIEPSAVNAVPSLIRVLKEDQTGATRQFAANALGKIGRVTQAVPALVQALTDPDINVRTAAAEALGKFGPTANEAIPTLLATIQDMNVGGEGLRRSSALALGQIGQPTSEVVEALAATLKDPHQGPRRFAAKGLGLLGAGAKLALSALIEVLGDQETFVREEATEAIGKIGGAIREIMPPLLMMCADSSSRVRMKAAQGLGLIGPEAVNVAPQLEKLTEEDPSGVVRVTAAVAMEKLTGDAERLIRILCGRLMDPEPEARVTAAEALRAMGPVARSAVPALADALKEGHYHAMAAIAITLGGMGPHAVLAVPALASAFLAEYSVSGNTSRLKWEDGPVYDMVRHTAAVALGKIGPAAREALPALREARRYQQAVVTAAEVAIQHIENTQTSTNS